MIVCIKNCWDCEHYSRQFNGNFFDDICTEHDIYIINQSEKYITPFNTLSRSFKSKKPLLDCSCKKPIDCKHEWEIHNRGGNIALEFLQCKKCGVIMPGFLWKTKEYIKTRTLAVIGI